jgi:hypothetical protein
MLQNFGAGIAAGFMESLFITPFEVLKTNLQTTKETHLVNVFKNIYKEKGINGLYKGFSPTCFRQSVNQAFNFSIYYKLRKYMVKEDDIKPTLYQIILPSLLSSSIGPIITQPFDIIKTRFQTPSYNYKSVGDAFFRIYKEEGLRAFFKGLGLRIIRVGGGQIIVFSVVEKLTYYLK